MSEALQITLAAMGVGLVLAQDVALGLVCLLGAGVLAALTEVGDERV